MTSYFRRDDWLPLSASASAHGDGVSMGDGRITMLKVSASGGVPRASRLDRRKARTRQALIDAAVRLIA